MNVNQKLEVIHSFAQEILTGDELRTLFEEKKQPVAYDGFEPSGQLHIAQGLLRAITLNKLASIGVKFKMLVADWHAMANNKFDGDLDKIQTCGKYFIEVWKAAGLDTDNVEFVWASELVKDPSYWQKVMQIARATTVQRALRCGQIMGRNEKDMTQASQIFYPCMQAADIFYLDVDIAQLGMDQRKVNILARELGEKLFGRKPVAVHHHMLMGLGEPPKTEDTTERVIALKMSKSNPSSAIFMTDSAAEVTKKIEQAYCPMKQVEENPVLDYCKHIIFERIKTLTIERPAKFGGLLAFATYAELEKAYAAGEVHPLDLKKAVAVELNKMLDPVRKHFEKNKKARKLYEQVKSFKITR